MAIGAEFQPPPTWANPMLEVVDPASGKSKVTFNPVWLKWFVDLTRVLTNSGGGNASGTIQFLIPPNEIAFGDIQGVNGSSDKFMWDDAVDTLLLGDLATSGVIRAKHDNSGGYAGVIELFAADGAGVGGNVTVAGGVSNAAAGGNVSIDGGVGDTNSGHVLISGGNSTAGVGGNVRLAAGTSAGTNGNVFLDALPTADPGVSGALWRDAAAGNVVKCSP